MINDAAFLALLASYKEALTMTERAVSVVRTLVESHDACQRLSKQAVLDYGSQCDQTERGIAALRAMVNAYKNEVRVHYKAATT